MGSGFSILHTAWSSFSDHIITSPSFNRRRKKDRESQRSLALPVVWYVSGQQCMRSECKTPDRFMGVTVAGKTNVIGLAFWEGKRVSVFQCSYWAGIPPSPSEIWLWKQGRGKRKWELKATHLTLHSAKAVWLSCLQHAVWYSSPIQGIPSGEDLPQPGPAVPGLRINYCHVRG